MLGEKDSIAKCPLQGGWDKLSNQHALSAHCLELLLNAAIYS